MIAFINSCLLFSVFAQQAERDEAPGQMLEVWKSREPIPPFQGFLLTLLLSHDNVHHASNIVMPSNSNAQRGCFRAKQLTIPAYSFRTDHDHLCGEMKNLGLFCVGYEIRLIN